jgi:hypothetical protein
VSAKGDQIEVEIGKVESGMVSEVVGQVRKENKST